LKAPPNEAKKHQTINDFTHNYYEEESSKNLQIHQEF
jgi:hypothetical protein